MVRGNKKSARKCYLEVLKKINREDARIHTISQQVNKGDAKQCPSPTDETEEIVIDLEKLERTIKIGGGLPTQLRDEVVHILNSFKILFALGLEDISKVDRSIIFHHLLVILGSKPVRQMKMHLLNERRDFMKKEKKFVGSRVH